MSDTPEPRELPATLTYDGWAVAVEAGRLLGQECPECGHVAGSPTGACPHCGNRDLRTVELPNSGTVYSETTIMVPPEEFETRGYQVALVEVGGARVLARIDGKAAIGERVDLSEALVTDDGHPAPVFEPRTD